MVKVPIPLLIKSGSEWTEGPRVQPDAGCLAGCPAGHPTEHPAQDPPNLLCHQDSSSPNPQHLKPSKQTQGSPHPQLLKNRNLTSHVIDSCSESPQDLNYQPSVNLQLDSDLMFTKLSATKKDAKPTTNPTGPIKRIREIYPNLNLTLEWITLAISFSLLSMMYNYSSCL